MSDTATFQISIPTDNDGYVLLKCEHCGELFKCTPNDIESDEVLSVFCPACGLTSESYITQDIIELAQAMVENYAMDMLDESLKRMERQFASNKFVSFKRGKRPKRKYENPIHSTIEDLQEKQCDYCGRIAKVNPLLKMSGSFCPCCGVINFEDE